MRHAVSEPECDRIRAVAEAEKTAVESGDIHGYLRLLSDDAVFLPPNTPAKSGDELRRWLREFLVRMSVRYTAFCPIETIVRDDLACHSYRCGWIATPKTGGAAMEMAFKGILILRRGGDDQWKIARSIWNAEPVSSPS